MKAPVRTRHNQAIGKITHFFADPQADYLAVLSDLVEQYEAEAPPILPASGAAMLAHLLEAQAVTPATVAQATGIPTATLEAVLAGTQALTREQRSLLARYCQVAPTVFALGE